MADLAELIEKVKAATGQDRGIDASVYRAINSLAPSASVFWALVPGYTASLDAVVALAEEVLPGWYVDHIGADAAGMPGSMRTMGWNVDLTDGSKYATGQAQRLEQAWLLAILTAKQEASNG